MQPLIETLQREARAEIIRFYNRTPAYRDVGEWETFINTIIADTVRRASEEATKRERERVIALLKDESTLAEVIYETLGAGYHYSTMPVARGIVSKMEIKIQAPTTPTETLQEEKPCRTFTATYKLPDKK